jgi:hypothetical protein
VTFTCRCGSASTRVSSAARHGRLPTRFDVRPAEVLRRQDGSSGWPEGATNGMKTQADLRDPYRLKATSGAGVDELAVAERLVDGNGQSSVFVL